MLNDADRSYTAIAIAAAKAEVGDPASTLPELTEVLRQKPSGRPQRLRDTNRAWPGPGRRLIASFPLLQPYSSGLVAFA
jgi:hypothetical protein